jgi:hypothetical protein
MFSGTVAHYSCAFLMQMSVCLLKLIFHFLSRRTFVNLTTNVHERSTEFPLLNMAIFVVGVEEVEEGLIGRSSTIDRT